MRFELQIFVGLIAVGLMIKKFDWRAQFMLFVFIVTWIMFNWKKG